MWRGKNLNRKIKTWVLRILCLKYKDSQNFLLKNDVVEKEIFF
jgi:hypothetical protein